MLHRPLAAALARGAGGAGVAPASGGIQAALATTSTRRAPAAAHTHSRRDGSATQVRAMGDLSWLHRGAGNIARQDAINFVRECFATVDTPVENANIMAEVLIEADTRGHFSHGLNRLEMYISDIETQSCNAWASAGVLNETPATAWVDGNNGLGPVVGRFCMNLAIEKAAEMGIGFVVAKGSNHYGIAGWYSMMALEHGMLGMTMTNTSPFMTPTRARVASLGTNPLSVAAPGLEDDHFCLDMATTAVAVGKIEVKRRKNEELPKGWALDLEGNPTTDAEKAMEARSLMPLGGEEESSGYKGFGLGLMVEVLTGILADGNYGHKIRKWGSTGEPANLGQCFMAINPQVFAPNFEERMSDLMNHLRFLSPMNLCKPVLVPGDPERNHTQKVTDNNAIPYTSALIQAVYSLADRLGVEPPRVR